MLPKHQGGFNLWVLKDKLISLQVKWMIKFENKNYHALWKENMGEIFNQTQRDK